MSQNFEWYFPDIKNGHKQGENDGMTYFPCISA